MSWNTSSASPAGDQLGRYQLLHRLAAGGMAELYLARASGIEGFEKVVVLKRILGHLRGNDTFVSMFLDEARIAANLEHPNIVNVYDIGKAGDDYFFTMAYLHGEDLTGVLRRAAELISETGRCVVEFEAAGAGVRSSWVRLESSDNIGPWFRWASVGIDYAASLAREVGLAVIGIHPIGDRVVATLAPE